MVALLLRISNNYEAGCRVCEIFARSARCFESVIHSRVHEVAQILRRVKRMNVKPIANLSRHATHVRIHTRHIDRDLRMFNAPGIEERRHQTEVVKPTVESEWGSILPAIPDRAQREHYLPQLRPRRLELH